MWILADILTERSFPKRLLPQHVNSFDAFSAALGTRQGEIAYSAQAARPRQELLPVFFGNISLFDQLIEPDSRVEATKARLQGGRNGGPKEGRDPA